MNLLYNALDSFTRGWIQVQPAGTSEFFNTKGADVGIEDPLTNSAVQCDYYETGCGVHVLCNFSPIVSAKREIHSNMPPSANFEKVPKRKSNSTGRIKKVACEKATFYTLLILGDCIFNHS